MYKKEYLIVIFFVIIILIGINCNEYNKKDNLTTISQVTKSSVISTPTVLSIPREVTYKFLKKWGTEGDGDGQFEHISDIAVDIDGNVYVSDSINKSIQKFTSDGKLIFRWDPESEPEKNFGKPVAIAVDVNKNIYIVSGSCFIRIFDSEGNYREVRGKYSTIYTSVVVDSDGNIYAMSRYIIDKYTSEGEFIKGWMISSFPDQRPLPPPEIAIEMEIDFKNNIFAKCIFNPYVDYRETKNQEVIITSLYKFNSSGKLINSYAIEEWESKPDSIAIDREDNIFLSDYNNDCILKVDSEGDLITKWGSKGSGDGEFNGPCDIVVDLEGNVYVADTGNHRIQKFSPVYK